MNDKNLINCLAQKQLKELEFEIKFNSNLKNKFKPKINHNPFLNNFSQDNSFVNNVNKEYKKNEFDYFNQNQPTKDLFSFDTNANLIENNFNDKNQLQFISISSNQPFNNFKNDYQDDWFETKFTDINSSTSSDNNSQTYTQNESNSSINLDNTLNNKINSSLNNLSIDLFKDDYTLNQKDLFSQNSFETNFPTSLINNNLNEKFKKDDFYIFDNLSKDNNFMKNENLNENKIINTKNKLENNDLKEDKKNLDDFLILDDDLNEDFGEFECYNDTKTCYNDNKTIDYKINVWQKILDAIVSILHKTFNLMMVSYDEISVIKALSTKKGKEFYLDLKEVFSVSKRINSSLVNTHSCEKLYSEIEKINKIWSVLDKIFQKTFPDLSSNFKNNESEFIKDSNKVCILCFSDSIIGNCQFYNFAGFDYHLSCANLWLNCVNSVLPRND